MAGALRRGGGCAFVVVWLNGLALLDGLAVGGVWCGLMAGGVAVCCAFVVVWLDGLALLDGLAVGGAVCWSDGWRRGGVLRLCCCMARRLGPARWLGRRWCVWSDGWRRGGGCAFVVVWLDGSALLDGLAVGGVWCGVVQNAPREG